MMGHLIFDKNAKAIQQGNKSFQQMVLDQLNSHMGEKRKKINSTLHHRQKLTQNGSQT